MTAGDLLRELRSCGAVVTINGDRVRVRAPKNAVPPRLRASLARLKPQVIHLLQDPASDAHLCPFRYADGDMDFGDIAAGWTPADWAAELRRKSERCSDYRIDMAEHYALRAANIEGRLAAIQDE